MSFAYVARQHELATILAACLVCWLGSLIALMCFYRALQDSARQRSMFAIASLAAGLGIWSTLLVGIIAFRPWHSLGYDAVHAALALVTTLGFSTLGFALALRQSPRSALAGGAIIGTGISLANWLTITGINIAGHIDLDYRQLALGALMSASCSAVAIWHHRQHPKDPPLATSILLVIATLGSHFIAAGTGTVDLRAAHQSTGWSIGNSHLLVVLVIAGQVLLSLLTPLVIFDRRRDAAALSLARERALAAEEFAKSAAERARLANELKHQVSITTVALENMAQGLSMYDADNRLVITNRQYCKLYDVPPELLVPGTPFEDVCRNLTSRVLPKAPPPGVPSDLGSWTGEHEITLLSGRVIAYQRRQLPDGGWIATHEDVTEARRSKEKILYLAAHDTLTALPNRNTFSAELDARLGLGQSLALLTIDLDRFKEVNDTLGHPVGDHILEETASRLKQLVGPNDLVARLGGDEFAIIQDLNHPVPPAVLAEAIVTHLCEPIEFDGHTVIVGASLGISLSPEDGIEGDELFKKSDLALYSAKEGSRGTYRFFEPGMDSRLSERRQLEEDLRVAIREAQFEVHYQPVLDTQNSRISCFEALVRWRHPERGLMQPAQFIATAEDSGLIIPIGEWVLRQACRDAAGWPVDVRVAVNLSPAQFKRGDLIAMTMNALAAAGLPPERLELEITETVLLHDEAWVHSVLQRLSELGVSIAMDDFGTGYSSLSYLRSFPFKKIKIDRSFIADMVGTSDALSIVQATIMLSRKLGMQITAEGVETAQQLDILAAEGCTQVQGFHISRPVQNGAVATLLIKYNQGHDAWAKAAG